LTEVAINRTSALLEEIAEGKPSSDQVDFYPEPRNSSTVSLNLDYVRELLGIEISEEEAVEILNSLSLKVVDTDQLEVEIPTFRLDVNRQEDLIEEIGRIYGYQNIEPDFSPVSLSAERNNRIYWKSAIRDILKNSGFFESYNYSFISEEQADTYNLSPERLKEVANPVSLNFKYLRPSFSSQFN